MGSKALGDLCVRGGTFPTQIIPIIETPFWIPEVKGMRLLSHTFKNETEIQSLIICDIITSFSSDTLAITRTE